MDALEFSNGRNAILEECDGPKTSSSAVGISFLGLPREIRDQIYRDVFSIPDARGDRALRIERRHLRYFKPTAATTLLLLHHEDLLLNRQVTAEALEILLKNHTIYLSCGPFVLKSLLTRIEEECSGQGKVWLRWLKKIELDWVTFPNLRIYPPNRENGKDEWWWESDGVEVDVDYIRGAEYNGHYDEYDYEGSYYDDNMYEPDDGTVYHASNQPPDDADPFGFSTHYPFADPERDPSHDTDSQEDLFTKLDLLVDMEVTPLFKYLAAPTFALSSITLPLYFVSKQTYHQRNTTRPGYGLPLKLRYWVQVAAHALLMLHHSLSSSPSSSLSSTLREVRIKYMPWDIWASMDPSDNLYRMEEKGVWYQSDEDAEREGEGAAFRDVWAILAAGGVDLDNVAFDAAIRVVPWEGDLEKWRVGDELEVVFSSANV